MSLITCKDCTKEFSTDAARCPNCGAKKPAGAIIVYGGGFLAFLAFGIVGSLVVAALSGNGGTSPRSLPVNQAKEVCQTFVKQSLHDPASAVFDDAGTYAVTTLSNEMYDVKVTLRAKNGFNAVRKMVVNCRTSPLRNGKWSAIYLEELH